MADDVAITGLDWENFQSFNSYNLSSTTQQRKIQLKDWSMVVIRDSLPTDDYSIFPPSNHENLHPPSADKDGQGNPVSVRSNSPSTSFRSSPSSSSFSSFSSSDDEISHSPPPMPSQYQVRNSRQDSRWMAFAIQILRSRIIATASKIWSKTARKTALWLSSPAVRIGFLVTLWWLYKRARHRRMRQSADRLRKIIKEKDEEIGQLLHQIAQLNGVLVSQQHGLPSN